jgi:hypothetical protein
MDEQITAPVFYERSVNTITGYMWKVRQIALENVSGLSA